MFVEGLSHTRGAVSGGLTAGLRIAMVGLMAGVGLYGCGSSETGGGEPASAAIRIPSGTSAEDRTAPTTPTDLTGAAVSPSQINLSWSGSRDNVGVTGYRIYRGGVLLATAGTASTYQDAGLAVSTTYSYTVQAIDRAGNASGHSTAAIVTTPAALDTVAPSTPTGLVANAVSNTRINVSWAASADNVAVTGYSIFRNGALFLTLGNVTTHQDTFLSPGTTYIYTVRAFDAAGNVSGLSAAAGATTSSTPDTTPPTAPTQLTAVGVTHSQVDLGWTASTDNDLVANYRVYRNGAFVAILASSSTTYQDTGLSPSATYSYNVDAIDASGNVSSLSAPASATTPAAPDTTPPSVPTGLAASVVSPFQINLSWSASSDNVGVAGYGVFRNGVLVAGLSVTTFEDTGLNPSTTYTYRVRAVDAAGNISGQSALASATTSSGSDSTSPTTPTGLAASAASASQIDLSWVASTDNVAVTGYRVYRNGTFVTTLGNVTTFRDNGLVPSTMYVYNLDAIDAAANASGVSAAASASTRAPDTATFSWDAVTAANLSGYRVYYGNAPGTYFQAVGGGDPVAAGVTTHVLTGLTSGTRYYFAVTAVYASGDESDFSAEVFKDIP